MVLCHLVAFIVWAWHPIVAKLKLLDAIAQPVETHVHGFRAARGDDVVDHTKCRRVVGLDGRRGLGVDHLDESMTGWDRFTEINVEGAKIGLGGGGHDGFDYLCDGEDGIVVGGVDGIVGHEKISAGAAPGVYFGEVRCIGMHRQDHITGVVSDDGVGVSGGVVEDSVDFFIVFCVGEACCVARDPSAVSIAKSTARAL